ncbi:MAG: M56 family metallopeptidase, partial [Lachnospiraceae bacterium]|nr:M56 family metallopeptidase [Lachnospiraceae bacterium]
MSAIEMLTWTVSSGLMILAVLIVRAVFGKKMRPGLRYALWGLVLLRLMIPGTIGNSRFSTTHVVQSVANRVSGYTPVGGTPSAATETEGRLPDIPQSGIHDPGQPAGIPDSQLNPHPIVENAVPGYTAFTDTLTGPNDLKPGVSVGGSQSISAAGKEEPSEKGAPKGNGVSRIGEYMMWGWFTGALLFLIIFLVHNLRFYLWLRARRLPLEANCSLTVYSVPGIRSSFLFGPAVYVQEELTGRQEAIRQILSHELAHFRHGDPLWAAFRLFCLVIHWFNPLVWLAAKKYSEDCELFADAAVVAGMNRTEKASYGELLVAVSTNYASGASLFSTAAMMGSNGKFLKERIKMMIKKPRTNPV